MFNNWMVFFVLPALKSEHYSISDNEIWQLIAKYFRGLVTTMRIYMYVSLLVIENYNNFDFYMD